MNIRKQQGFTIIEVVLVLAIAGLIFLMVFIALPALQKGQRDTQRRNDISRFRAQVNQYQANNKGSVPTITDATTAGTFVTNYLRGSGDWKDPLTGNDYTFVVYTTDVATTLGTTAGNWTYKSPAKCAGEAFDTTITGVRTYAVAMKLEGAGITCQDNQ